MAKLSAVDVLILRAVRDGVIERATPHVPVNVLGVECDRGQLYDLQSRGLLRLDHSYAPALTVEGQVALDVLESAR
jgi:hypothetical protein